ncbi:MAG: protein of unknown function with transrane region [Parcubacteria group bacterium]|nr:protein of unknown function with transrane region [Parcubacteria group bacterium]
MSNRFLLKTGLATILFAALVMVAAPHVYADTPCNQLIDDNGNTFCAPPPTTTATTPAPATAPAIGNGNPGAAPAIGNGNPTSPAPSATGVTGAGAQLVNPLKNITDLPSLLKALLAALIQIGTVVLILAFVWIGFSFVRAQGNPKAIAAARSALIWTIIGGGILLGAQAISTLIQSTVSNL